MRRFVRWAVSIVVLLQSEIAIAKGIEQHQISIEDLVRQATVGDSLYAWAGAPVQPDNLDLSSPDDKHYAFIVSRGNPSAGANESDLFVGDVSDLKRNISPRLVAHFESKTNYYPISLLHWLRDNNHVVFAGTNGNAITQIYEIDVQSHALTQLTHVTKQFMWFDITPDGHRLITVDPYVEDWPSSDPALRDGFRINNDMFYAALTGIDLKWTDVRVYDLVGGGTQTLRKYAENDPSITTAQVDLLGGISPDGRFAIRQVNVNTTPTWWNEYKAPSRLVKCISLAAWCLWQPVLLDLETGRERPLSDAPWASSNLAPVWIDGGRHLIAAGVAQTLSGAYGTELNNRKTRSAILEIDPETGATKRIGFLDPRVVRATSAKWNETSQTLTVDSSDAANPFVASSVRVLQVFARVKGRWFQQTAPVSQANPGGTRIVVHQSLNEPPVLQAIDELHRPHTILELDPWLKQRTVPKVQQVSWKGPDGLTVSGGLYLPASFDPKKRYPVVLQTHGFSFGEFSLNGASRQFVGQALASAGIVVLQIGEHVPQNVAQTPRECITIQAEYEAAIDFIVAKGIADRSRIGIQGWSRTGSYVDYFLTHSKYPVAVVADTETADNGWWAYLASGSLAAKEYEQDNGADPFSTQGLSEWAKVVPTFNLDRWHAPTLLWSALTPISQWDIYAGLRLLHRPVEYWVMPNGVHNTYKVSQRISSGHLLLDWYRFWLQGYEDPDPAKHEQYVRWEKLRAERDADAKVPSIIH